MVYWVGLILLTLASLVLFVVAYPGNLETLLKGLVPVVVVAAVFLALGAYMMKEGLR